MTGRLACGAAILHRGVDRLQLSSCATLRQLDCCESASSLDWLTPTTHMTIGMPSSAITYCETAEVA